MSQRLPTREDIKELLKDRIGRGELAVGDRVPSEYKLVEQLGVGRGRVRQALLELQLEGFIVRKRGSGSYVAKDWNGVATVRNVGQDTVAMVIPRYTCRYSREVVEGFMRHTAGAGRQTIVYNNQGNGGSEAVSLRAIVDAGVAGLVAWIDHYTPAVHDLLLEMKSKRFPVVLVDRYVEGLGVDHVASENKEIGYRLTKALIENGHSRIAFAGYKADVSSIADRFTGYVRAIDEANLGGAGDSAARPAYHVSRLDLKPIWDAPGDVVKEVMVLRDRPTAFVCIHDLVAKWLYRELEKLGYQAPDDVEFAAVHDEYPTDLSPLPMFLIAQDARSVGAESGEVLLTRMAGQDGPVQCRSVQPGPVERKSA